MARNMGQHYFSGYIFGTRVWKLCLTEAVKH